MKILSSLVLTGALVLSAFAQAPSTSSSATPAAKDSAAAQAIPATAAEIAAPFVLKDGALSQPEQTDASAGGKAVFTFTVPKAGKYVIHAIANAPDEHSNSYFLNIDAQPEEPLMIWDLAVTNGFEERIVSWRGNGDDTSNEHSPKVFELSAGEHKLIVRGREPGQLKSVSIRPYAK